MKMRVFILALFVLLGLEIGFGLGQIYHTPYVDAVSPVVPMIAAQAMVGQVDVTDLVAVSFVRHEVRQLAHIFEQNEKRIEKVKERWIHVSALIPNDSSIITEGVEGRLNLRGNQIHTIKDLIIEMDALFDTPAYKAAISAATLGTDL